MFLKGQTESWDMDLDPSFNCIIKLIAQSSLPLLHDVQPLILNILSECVKQSHFEEREADEKQVLSER